MLGQMSQDIICFLNEISVVSENPSFYRQFFKKQKAVGTH